MCRSWEHLCLLLSFLSFLPPRAPSFLARGVFTSKLGFCNRFSNEVWFVIGLSPFIWFPFHRPPLTVFFLFSFMSFCLHVSSSSSFLSLARTIVRTLVCTHTRTRTLLTARFRWPRFVSMRFGSSVVPLHLVPFHRQPHTPLSVLSFSFSSVPFCVHMCLPPFRAGWRSHMPPFGEACVCNPWNHRDPFGFLAGGMAAVSLAMPTKLRDSAGRECGRTFLYLQRELFSSCSTSVFCSKRLMQR